MAQRLRGQETFVLISKDNQLQARIDSIQDTEITFELEIQEEQYLGETANRYDSIFNGMSIRSTMHLTNKQAVLLADSAVARAQRRQGGATRIDIMTVLVFPNGDLVSILVLDVQFGAIPISDSSRSDYVSLTLEGKASQYKFI